LGGIPSTTKIDLDELVLLKPNGGREARVTDLFALEKGIKGQV
jgi:hypothetical protein